jgi:hypothetical protein
VNIRISQAFPESLHRQPPLSVSPEVPGLIVQIRGPSLGLYAERQFSCPTPPECECGAVTFLNARRVSWIHEPPRVGSDIRP